MKNEKINIFWFRRDLSLEDNHALYQALSSGYKVLPIFIFDIEILDELSSDDSRVSFIYDTLSSIDKKLKIIASSLLMFEGTIESAFSKLLSEYRINAVYSNEDYETYAISRDKNVTNILQMRGITHYQFKNQVIFAKNEILKKDQKPYTVFTPYKNAWLKKFNEDIYDTAFPSEKLTANFLTCNFSLPNLSEIGFKKGKDTVKDYDLSKMHNYDKIRDIPSEISGTFLGPHLRFGTISIRKLFREFISVNETFISELIWREFFMQILFHYPKSEKHNFKPRYDSIKWRNNEAEFQAWCEGKTGYPIVDAGMKQLNSTGYMHNRIRMITAGFLTKHLLIDWRWGEAYFASKLLDYELSSNVGNWQWAASTGCDSVPYFRIFNPHTQQLKFDKNYDYVRKFIPDFNKNNYLPELVNHNFARNRALETFKNID